MSEQAEIGRANDDADDDALVDTDDDADVVESNKVAIPRRRRRRPLARPPSDIFTSPGGINKLTWLQFLQDLEPGAIRNPIPKLGRPVLSGGEAFHDAYPNKLRTLQYAVGTVTQKNAVELTFGDLPPRVLRTWTPAEASSYRQRVVQFRLSRKTVQLQSYEQAHEVANCLKDLLERSTLNVDAFDYQSKTILISAACRLAFPLAQNLICLVPPDFHWTNPQRENEGPVSMRIKCSIFDLVRGVPKHQFVYIKVPRSTPVFQPSQTSFDKIFFFELKKGVRPIAITPLEIAVEQCLKIIQTEIHGRVFDTRAAGVFVRTRFNQLAGQPILTPTSVDTTPLDVFYAQPFVFQTSEDEAVLEITPSAELEEDLPGASSMTFKIPIVQGSADVRAAVMEEFDKALRSADDMASIMAMFVLELDRRVRAAGWETSNGQLCSGRTNDNHRHMCGGCQVMKPCGEFRSVGARSRRICAECFSLVSKQWSFRNLVKNLVRSEHVLLDIDLLQRQQEYDLLTRRLATFSQNDDETVLFRDIYLDTVHPEERQSDETSPFQLSGDAIQAIHLVLESGRIHHPDNIGPTALWVNLFKWIYPAITLHIIRLLAEANAESDLDEVASLKVRLDHVYLITKQLPHARERRLRLKFTPAQYDTLRTQYETGLADPEACENIIGAWALVGGRHAYSTGNPAIDTPQWDDVMSIIEQAEVRHNKLLPRLYGVIYPFNCGRLPAVWSKECLYYYFAHRLEALTYCCNRYYTTTCTVAHLIIVWCLQFLAPIDTKNPCTGFFAPYSRHPLCGSIGKRVHGLDMTSGLGITFSRLEDWIQENCNLVCEIWIWNTGKSRWDMHVDRMLADFKNLRRNNPPYWPETLPPLTALPEVLFTARRADDMEVDGHDDGWLLAMQQAVGQNQEGQLIEDLIVEARQARLRRQAEDAAAASGLAQGDSNTPLAIRAPGTNMSNWDSCCYMVTGIQLLHGIPLLRDLLRFNSQFPVNPSAFENLVGRRTHNMQHVKDLLARLKSIFNLLDLSDPQLPRGNTRALIIALNNFDSNIVIPTVDKDETTKYNDMFEPLGIIMEILQRSSNPRRLEFKRATEIYMEQDARIKDGLAIDNIGAEFEKFLEASRAEGSGSLFTKLFQVIIVQEAQCPEVDCPSPISRVFFSQLQLVLDIPNEFPNQRGVTVSELLDHSLDVHLDAGPRCGFDSRHPTRLRNQKRLMKTSPVLLIRIDRSKATMARTGLRYSVRYNHVILEEELDFAPWIHKRLPSEQHEAHSSTFETKYVLTGVGRFLSLGKHYIAFNKIRIGGELNWVCYDSLTPQPFYKSPLIPQQGACDYGLIYTRLDVVKPTFALAGRRDDRVEPWEHETTEYYEESLWPDDAFLTSLCEYEFEREHIESWFFRKRAETLVASIKGLPTNLHEIDEHPTLSANLTTWFESNLVPSNVQLHQIADETRLPLALIRQWVVRARPEDLDGIDQSQPFTALLRSHLSNHPIPRPAELRAWARNHQLNPDLVAQWFWRERARAIQTPADIDKDPSFRVIFMRTLARVGDPDEEVVEDVSKETFIPVHLVRDWFIAERQSRGGEDEDPQGQTDENAMDDELPPEVIKHLENIVGMFSSFADAMTTQSKLSRTALDAWMTHRLSLSRDPAHKDKTSANELALKEQQLIKQANELKLLQISLASRERRLGQPAPSEDLDQREIRLNQRESDLAEREIDFDQRETNLSLREGTLSYREKLLAEQEATQKTLQNNLDDRASLLLQSETALQGREKAVQVRQEAVSEGSKKLNKIMEDWRQSSNRKDAELAERQLKISAREDQQAKLDKAKETDSSKERPSGTEPRPWPAFPSSGPWQWDPSYTPHTGPIPGWRRPTVASGARASATASQGLAVAHGTGGRPPGTPTPRLDDATNRGRPAPGTGEEHATGDRRRHGFMEGAGEEDPHGRLSKKTTTTRSRPSSRAVPELYATPFDLEGTIGRSLAALTVASPTPRPATNSAIPAPVASSGRAALAPPRLPSRLSQAQHPQPPPPPPSS